MPNTYIAVVALRAKPSNYLEPELAAGMCARFKAGAGNGHRLLNQSTVDAVYLEIGDRTDGDEVTYPDEDLVAQSEGSVWKYFHKNGEAYA